MTGNVNPLIPVAWQGTLIALGCALTGLLLVFHSPISSAASLWWNISTYNHAFLILPISVLLILEKKGQLKALSPKPCYWGLLGIAGFSFLWLASSAADVAEGEHFAIMGMIQALLLTVLGKDAFRILMFPILYLWLMVPTGTFLLPALQWIATLQVEALLSFSGIPVFTQNTLIEVPSGLYTVAPGCAGLNFIFTSLALAPLYAYYMYHGLAKRITATGVLLIVALLANALRIFAIIALAEFTNKRIDIVDDHLLYGWGFFALVLVVMALIGWRYADPEQQTTPLPQLKSRGNTQATKIHAWEPALAAILALLIASFPAAYTAAREHPDLAGHITLSLPGTSGTWTQIQSTPDWTPTNPSAHGKVLTRYSSEQCCVDLYIAYYQIQTQEREVIASKNRLTATTQWQIAETRGQKGKFPQTPSTLSETTLISGARQRLAWHYYWVDGQFTSNRLIAKLLEAKAKLLWGENRAATVILSTEITNSRKAATSRLHNFLESGFDMRLILEQAHWTPQDITHESHEKE